MIYHQTFDCDFHVGDVLEVCTSLPEKSVHCIVTSPPYWGLRDYGIAPSIWGGDSDHCHSWSDEVVIEYAGAPGSAKQASKKSAGRSSAIA